MRLFHFSTSRWTHSLRRKGPYFKEAWQARWRHWLKWELEIFHEILVHCALLYSISMDNWELMVLSLACIIISLYYEVMERSFYRKAVKLVKPDLNIFLVKIIFYLSSGIGKNKISCLKKKQLFFLSAPQLYKSLLKELYFLFGQEFKLCSWTFQNRINFAYPATGN